MMGENGPELIRVEAKNRETRMTDKTHLRICYSDKPTQFGQPGNVEVLTAGDGSIDHFVDSFRAMLVACGYSTKDAGRLIFQGSELLPKPVEVSRDLSA